MRSLIPILLLCLALAGCTSPGMISRQNLSYLYNPKSSNLKPQYFIQLSDTGTAILHYRIHTDDLLYSKGHDEKLFSSQIDIHYQLFSSFKSEDILDSGTVNIIHKKPETEQQWITGKSKIPLPGNGDYILAVRFHDLKRNHSFTDYLSITSHNINSAQNYLLQGPGSDQIFYNRHFDQAQEVHIIHSQNDVNSLQVKYYNNDFPVASPPFSIENEKPMSIRPDSVFWIQKNKQGFALTLYKQGIFHIQADTSLNGGLTIFRFHQGFPTVNTTIHLIRPLRFITSKNEFEALLNAKEPKKALDDFWLENGTNKEKARELIQSYYNRVKYANELFTSYHEGWKTDRGLIYIVYGLPNHISKTNYSESWTYGEVNNSLSVTFTFIKMNNPFSENDYKLTRSPMVKTSWYNAVDLWRQGRIFFD